MTFFFDSCSSLLGVYVITNGTEPSSTDEEKTLWDSFAPYVFYAYRKHKYYENAGFFSNHSSKDSLFAVILADRKVNVLWLNSMARTLFTKTHKTIPSTLPNELLPALPTAVNPINEAENESLIFQEIEMPSSYGSVIATKFDKQCNNIYLLTAKE